MKSIDRMRASRRSRLVATTAATAMVAVSIGVTTGTAYAVTPASNPNLQAQCGLDIGLVLDGSGSISDPGKGTSNNPVSAVPDVRAAAKAFLSPLADTNTNAGIISFSTVMKGDADVTMQALTSSSYSSTFVPEIDRYGSSGWTNWDIALRTAKQRFIDSAANRPGVPDLIVVVTDGAPNTIGGAPGQTVTNPSGTVNDVTGGNASPDASNAAVDPAVTAANAIKAAGAHILVVGAGQAFNSNANAVTYRSALAKISGLDAHDPDNVLTAAEKGTGKYQTGPFNASTTDVVLVKSFTDLGTELGKVANALCGGSLTIKKLASTPEDPGTYSPATGWTFNAAPAAPNAAYEWILPTASTGDTNQNGTTAGAQASTTFQWKVSNQSQWNANKAITVNEDVKTGFTFESVVCEGATATVTDAAAGIFTVPVGVNDIVTCTVKNKASKVVDVELDKSIIGSAPYALGTDRTWKLSVTNKGPSDATGVEVVDTLPAGFSGPYTFTPSSGVTTSSGTVTWAVGTLTSGQTKTLEIKGTLSQLGSMTNFAQVTKTVEKDVDSTPNNCTVGQTDQQNEDDCDKETIDVTRVYDLDIDKVRVGSGSVSSGDQIQFDLKVTNKGPSPAAANLVVTDDLPDGLLNVSAAGQGTDAGNWTCSGVPLAGPTDDDSFTCTYSASLAKDATRTVRVTATVGESLADRDSVLNNACVKKGANATVNDDCDDERIDLTPKSDLITQKSAVKDQVVTGEAAAWTFSVKNLGPSVKKAPFTVTDSLPDGLTDVSITPGAGWACSTGDIGGPTSGTTFTCTFTPGPAGLAVNASTSTIAVSGTTTQKPAQGASVIIVNTACVADGYAEIDNTPNDNNDGNDCGFDDVTVLPKVDLKMNKVVDTESDATVGDTLEFRFSVTNNGPSAATTIGFTDTFDAGLTDLAITSATNWDCSLTGSTLDCDWTGGAVAAGQTTATDVVVTAVVGTALADADQVQNTACVKADDLADDKNDCDTTTTELDPTYGLTIDKAQLEANPRPVGSEVSYDLSVSNTGPSKAVTGFVVVDEVPAPLDLTGVSVESDDWDCSATDVEADIVSCTWTGADLPVGPAPDIRVTATVTVDAANADPVINTACVARDARAKVEDCGEATTEFPSGDLTLGKSNEPGVDEPLEGFGGTITYTLTATAGGTLDQTGVVVTDTVPGPDSGLDTLDTTLVDGSVRCIDNPIDRNTVDCNGALPGDGLSISGDNLAWSLGTITAGTSKYATFQVTVDLPAIDDVVDPDAELLLVRNQAFASSDFDDEVPSNIVENPVKVTRLAGDPSNSCEADTPRFSLNGSGFYAGETVKMRVFESDGTTVVSEEYATRTAAADGTVSFDDVIWPGFSQDPVTGEKTYPSLDLRPLVVELYGSPATAKVTVAYPDASAFCDAGLEIVKDNAPNAETTITEFGAEIEYTMTVSYPEGAAYNAENVQVTDILPGYDDTFPSPPFGAVTYVDGSAECAPFTDPVGICQGGFSGDFYDAASRTVKFNLGQMQPGTTRTVSFTVTVDTQFVDGPGTVEFDIANRATVTSDFTKPDFDDARNQVEVEPEAGITIEKTASNNPGGALEDANFFDSVAGVLGEVTTFRFEVTNTGDAAVTDLVLGDDLNFGPAEDDSVLDSLNEDDLSNCRVGAGDEVADGFSQSFAVGSTIGDDSTLVLEAGESVFLYCDLLVPAGIDEDLLDLNRIFNRADITGDTVLGGVEADSNLAVVKLFPEIYDAFPIKNIVDEDGTNPRAFDILGEPTEASLKTFRMTIDNVSDQPLDFTLYDYFENESVGLSTSEREAIFDSMKCIDYDAPEAEPFNGTFPNPVLDNPDPAIAGLPEVYDEFPAVSQETTFGESSTGDGAGTYYARAFDLGVIQPGDGYEIVCQAILPAGEYELVNTFRMVANPVQEAQPAGRVGRAAAAVSGELDLTASAGVILGEPTIDVDDPDEPAEPEPTPTPSVKGTKLPNTGLGLPVGTLAALGLVLVGAGALLGTIARRRREEAAHS